MSMSMHVVAIKPPDEDWKKHKAVWDACRAAGIVPPRETMDFFNHEHPDDAGVLIHLGPYGADQNVVKAREWKDEMQEGFEVDLVNLPPGTKTVRFFCSW